MTPLESLRKSCYGYPIVSFRTAFREEILGIIADKGYPLDMIRDRIFSTSFISLIQTFLLRENFTTYLVSKKRFDPVFEDYRGTLNQNSSLNGSLSKLSHHTLHRTIRGSYSFFGEEAAVLLSNINRIYGNTDLPLYYSNIPIAIVGYGAAGIITARALRYLGFLNITIFERRKKVAGIWSESSVHFGSRNNPKDLNIFGEKLSRAPGEGLSVLRILDKVHRNILGIPSIDTFIGVKRIIPGDLHHVIELDDGTTREFPIVINCCGIGSPRPISDPTKMIGPKNHVRAVRWQYPQITPDEIKGKMFIFIGLGNSTAEMMQQIQKFPNDSDYRILTHYPFDSVHSPSNSIFWRGVNYQVFRDLSKPELTGFQGDLSDSYNAYFKALKGGKIISDVVQWDVKENNGKRHIGVRLRGGKKIEDLCQFDELYVLTGYQHSAKSLDAMGFSYDKEGLYPYFDYDGEFMREPFVKGGDRLFKGYFGLGSILDSPGNRNSVVIPGMIFRAPDMLFGIIIRVAEYYHRHKIKAKEATKKIISLLDPDLLSEYDIRLVPKNKV